MSDVIDILSSPSFVETVAVLLITALLTGLLVPIVKSRMDRNNLEKQQLFQEALARRTKIVDAQAELLEVLAEVLGGLRLLFAKISFYAREGRNDKYDAAFRDYDDRSWELMARYRTQLSKAFRLTSPQTWERLRVLYYDVLVPTDRRLYELVEQNSPTTTTQPPGDRAAWGAFFDYVFHDFTDEVDQVLSQVAEEIRKAET